MRSLILKAMKISYLVFLLKILEAAAVAALVKVN